VQVHLHREQVVEMILFAQVLLRAEERRKQEVILEH